jgi:hypothetical protein
VTQGQRPSQTRGVRHHAASRPATAIGDVHDLTSQQIIDLAQEHLDNKERRKRTRRTMTAAAKRKADERRENMP